MDIGAFFKNARNVPDVNMIYINTTTDEKIDSATFASLRTQVENHLINNDLVDSINYLVTTKGVPLSVNNGCVIDPTTPYECASVDSELTLILGSMSTSIGENGSILNPYFDSHDHFSRENEGFYLVTRLSGYSVADVYRMIDNSGPETGINQSTGLSIVDISNSTGNDSTYFVDTYTPVYDTLLTGGWNAVMDVDNLPLVNQSNVNSYFGLGHGPLPSAVFNYDWNKGAVGAMSMCNSAFTFDQTTNTTNGVLIADLIAGGCTGALGHVDYIFFSQIIPMEIFVDRYYDPVMNFNLAESFYMAETRFSWQTVVIGDPKASVVIDNLANIYVSEQANFNVYPNPSSGIIQVESSHSINDIQVFDLSGKTLNVTPQFSEKNATVDFYNIQSGVYILQVNTEAGIHKERVVVRH